MMCNPPSNIRQVFELLISVHDLPSLMDIDHFVECRTVPMNAGERAPMACSFLQIAIS